MDVVVFLRVVGFFRGGFWAGRKELFLFFAFLTCGILPRYLYS